MRAVFAIPILLVAALAPYVATLHHGFAPIDDRVTLIDLPLLRQLSFATLPEFFRPDLRPGLLEYMPLKNLSYALDVRLFGFSAAAFRPQQWFWHAAAVLLLWGWLRTVLAAFARRAAFGIERAAAEPIALVAALWFAAHPVHVESVTWLSGRKDVLSGAFMIASAWAAWRALASDRTSWRSVALAHLALVFAMFSKPTAMVAPALWLLQDWLRAAPVARARRVWLYAPAFLMVGAFAFFYLRLTSGYRELAPGDLYHQFAGPPWMRWGQQLGVYLWIGSGTGPQTPLLAPSLLGSTWSDPRAWGGAVLLLAFLATAGWAIRRRHALALALGWLAVPLAPVLIDPPWGQYVAGRYMYLPVAGVALAASVLGARALTVAPRLRSAALPVACAVALLLGLHTWMYNALWRDGTTLFAAAADEFPDYAPYYLLAASDAIRRGERERALALAERCLTRIPEDAECGATVAHLLSARDPASAEVVARRMLPYDRTGEVHRVLAEILIRTGRAQQAVAFYEPYLAAKRVVSNEELGALSAFALHAGLADKALHYARECMRALAGRYPGAAPPTELFRAIAARKGDAALGARVETAARCVRADCFARAMGG